MEQEVQYTHNEEEETLDAAVETRGDVSSNLDLNLDDAVEEEVLEPDEYRFRISDARKGRKDERSQEYLLIRAAPIDFPTGKELVHIMMIPDSEFDDDRDLNRRKLALRRFFEACGFGTQVNIDVSELIGQEFAAVVRIEEDPEYGEQNRIRRFVTGH